MLREVIFLEIAGSALQAGQSLRPPHLYDAAPVLHHEQDLVFIYAFQHVAFDLDVAPHVGVGTKAEFVIFDALSLHPFDCLVPVALVPTRAEDNVNVRIVKDFAKPDHRRDRFVFRHSLEKRVPVFRVCADVVLAGGDVGERSVDIENDDFLLLLRHLLSSPIILQ